MKGMALLRRLFWVVPVGCLIGGGVFLSSQPAEVAVTRPVRKRVSESIAASGTLRGQIETSVGAQVAGRVVSVAVREGAIVRQGQVLARLDDGVLREEAKQAADAVETTRAQLRQAENAIATARASLIQTARPPLPADVARLRAEIAQSVETAAAKRLAAQQRLAELEAGPVAEEKEQAEAKVREAEANYADAQRDRDRQKKLSEMGAVARVNYDTAATKTEVALRTLESARSRLKQLERGTRPEQIAQAKADLRAADATLAGAKATGEQQLRVLLSQPRPEDVLLARRRLDEAVQARAVAERRQREAEQTAAVATRRGADTVVLAPFDGTVTEILVEVGGITGPSQPILRLVRSTVPEIRVDLDEINLGRARVGQEAIVTSEAFPGKSIAARVRELGAQVDSQRGTVLVRLTPLSTPAWLRPGLTLSVNIIVDPGTERLVIPLTSVSTVGVSSTVLVAENGVIASRPVTVGPPGADSIPILEGLTERDSVVVNPTGRKAGQKVRPVAEKKEG